MEEREIDTLAEDKEEACLEEDVEKKGEKRVLRNEFHLMVKVIIRETYNVLIAKCIVT